jgi:hypothetical protein
VRLDRHCEQRSDEAIHASAPQSWIASRSLSSGARSRDPLARNDESLDQRVLLRLHAVAHVVVTPFSHLMQAAMHCSRLFGL